MAPVIKLHVRIVRKSRTRSAGNGLDDGFLSERLAAFVQGGHQVPQLGSEDRLPRARLRLGKHGHVVAGEVTAQVVVGLAVESFPPPAAAEPPRRAAGGRHWRGRR